MKTKETCHPYLQLVLEHVDRLAGAGVRVLEVGEGMGRVRVELEPRPGQVPTPAPAAETGTDLIRKEAHAIFSASAHGQPAGPEQADPTEAAHRAEGEQPGAAEQAGDDLDVAHLG